MTLWGQRLPATSLAAAARRRAILKADMVPQTRCDRRMAPRRIWRSGARKTGAGCACALRRGQETVGDGARGQELPTDDSKISRFQPPALEYFLVAPSGVFAGPDEAAEFAVTYYPETTVSTEVQSCCVTLQDVTGITFQLVPGTMSTCSGVITERIRQAGSSLDRSGAHNRWRCSSRESRGSQSNPDGTFVIRMSAGSYVLQAFGDRQYQHESASAHLGALSSRSMCSLSDLGRENCSRVTLRGGSFLKAQLLLRPVQLRFNPVPIDFATGPVGGAPAVSVTNDD